jgi:hypothetical protein
MTPSPIDAPPPPAGTAATLKSAVVEVVGRGIVAGLSTMAYGATLFCWLSEQAETRGLIRLGRPA